MFKSLSNLLKVTKREEGQGLVEYALILVLVSVVVIVVLSLVGPGVGNIFSQVTTALNGAAAGESVSGTCLQHNGGGNDWLIDGESIDNATQLSSSDGSCSGSSIISRTWVNAASQGAGDSKCAALGNGYTAGDHMDDNGYQSGWYLCYPV